MKSLQQVLSDPRIQKFITPETITLTYKSIQDISSVPTQFTNCLHLHLSHNHIESLEGLQNFKRLQSLSLCYNQISDWHELLHIPNKENLRFLRVKSNPFTMYPDYQSQLIENFPNLENLDDLKIDKNIRSLADSSLTVVARYLIQLLYYLQDEFQAVDQVINKLNIHQELEFLHDTYKINRSANSVTVKNRFVNQLVSVQALQVLEDFMSKSQIVKNQKENSSTAYACFFIQLLYLMMPLFVNRKQVTNKIQFNDIYRDLFKAVILHYNSKYDKKLEKFLQQQCENNQFYDKELLQSDKDYVFKCYMLEFYHLQPLQAHVLEFDIFEEPNPLLFPRQLRADKVYQEQMPNNLQFLKGCDLNVKNMNYQINRIKQENDKYPYKSKSQRHSLDIDQQNPDYLKQLILQYFPVFPFNQSYMETLFEAVNDRISSLLNAFAIMKKIQTVQNNKDQVPEKQTMELSKILNDNTQTNQIQPQLGQDINENVKNNVNNNNIQKIQELEDNKKKKIQEREQYQQKSVQFQSLQPTTNQNQSTQTINNQLSLKQFKTNGVSQECDKIQQQYSSEQIQSSQSQKQQSLESYNTSNNNNLQIINKNNNYMANDQINNRQQNNQSNIKPNQGFSSVQQVLSDRTIEKYKNDSNQQNQSIQQREKNQTQIKQPLVSSSQKLKNTLLQNQDTLTCQEPRNQINTNDYTTSKIIQKQQNLSQDKIIQVLDKCKFFAMTLKRIIQKPLQKIMLTYFKMLQNYNSEKTLIIANLFKKLDQRRALKNWKSKLIKMKKCEIFRLIKLKRYFSILKNAVDISRLFSEQFREKCLKLKIFYCLLKMVCKSKKYKKGVNTLLQVTNKIFLKPFFKSLQVEFYLGQIKDKVSEVNNNNTVINNQMLAKSQDSFQRTNQHIFYYPSQSNTYINSNFNNMNSETCSSSTRTRRKIQKQTLGTTQSNTILTNYSTFQNNHTQQVQDEMRTIRVATEVDGKKTHNKLPRQNPMKIEDEHIRTNSYNEKSQKTKSSSSLNKTTIHQPPPLNKPKVKI